MKHRLLDKQSLGSSQWRIVIELLPDTSAEAAAIQHVAQTEADETERVLVENYLNFNLGLGSYSVVKLLKQQDRRIALQIVI
jgi:hypothetical protein